MVRIDLTIVFKLMILASYFLSTLELLGAKISAGSYQILIDHQAGLSHKNISGRNWQYVYTYRISQLRKENPSDQKFWIPFHIDSRLEAAPRCLHLLHLIRTEIPQKLLTNPSRRERLPKAH